MMIGRDTFWPQASVLTSPAWQVLPDKLPIYQLINGPTLQLFISYTKISSFPAAQLLHMCIVCNWYIGGVFFGVFCICRLGKLLILNLNQGQNFDVLGFMTAMRWLYL